MNNHLYHCIYKDVKLKNTKLTAAKVEEDSYDYLNTFLVKGCDLDISIYMVYAYESRTVSKDAKINLDIAIFYTGNEEEEYLAKLFNEYTLRLSNEDLETEAKCHFNPIKLTSKDKDKQIQCYIEGLESNVLSEDACYALSDSGKMTDAFSYEIKPLNTTLSQPGNDVRGLNNNKDSFKFFPGDTVNGYCPFDKKWHKGMIKYLYYDGSDQKMPKYVYIQDFNDESTIAVEADNLKSCYVKPEFQFRVSPGPYDNFRYRPVMEKVYKAIDNGIQKALIISNGQENDVSVKWHEKGKASDLNLINYLTDEFKENGDIECYLKILSYHNEHPNNRYNVKDIHELIGIYYKIWICCNKYNKTDGLVSKLPIDLKWIDTENALTFIKYDKAEFALHEYDEDAENIQFIKFKNIKDCDHPIIIHKDLFIDKWLNWNNKEVNVKKFNNKDCAFGYDNIIKDFNGYEHTYNNANIGDYSTCKMPYVYFIDDYQNYPALKSAISIDYDENFDGYRSYLPAIGELLFLGDCYENMFLDYILKYMESSANIEMHKDLWWSSTEKSYDQVAVINANPRIPASAFKTENKKNSGIFQMGHIIPMFKEI